MRRDYTQLKSTSQSEQALDSLDVTDFYCASIDGKQQHVQREHQGSLQFNTNNGLLAFTTDNGNVHIAKNTQENVELLRDRGYNKTGLGVPFSNGCPADMKDRSPADHARLMSFSQSLQKDSQGLAQTGVAKKAPQRQTFNP